MSREFMDAAKKRMAQHVIANVVQGYEHRLDEAVENDYRLLQRAATHRPRLFAKAKQIRATHRSFIKNLDTDDMFDFLKEKKPGLYQRVTEDPKREQWARREVTAILNFLKMDD